MRQASRHSGVFSVDLQTTCHSDLYNIPSNEIMKINEHHGILLLKPVDVLSNFHTLRDLRNLL